MLLIALLSVPLVTALLALAVRNSRILSLMTIVSGVVSAALAAAIAVRITAGPLALGPFYADALSAFFILTIALVNAASAFYSRDYLAHDESSGEISARKASWYYVFYNVFAFTMYLVPLVNNTGMMWAAIELTTLVSAFLVGFYNNKRSIEAAWKYIVICSVGITFALLGTVLFFYSVSLHGGLRSLNWTDLIAVAPQLDPRIVKIAFLFILVGYGTKAGLAPMHTWLPDAHSQAPAPVSAMLSGVLLKTAVYAIIRFAVVANRSAGPLYTGNLLLVFGLLSLGVAAVFMLVQKDAKRLLAYSSIEHIGVISVGLGFGGPLGLYGALLHIFNHAAAKPLMFFGTGKIVKKYGTNNMHVIRGALDALPFTGMAVFVGVFALAGAPPFGLFVSEMMIVISGFTHRAYTASALLLAFLAVVFAALVFHFGRMLCGKKPDGMAVSAEGAGTKFAIVLLLAVIAVTGIAIPGPLNALLNAAVRVVQG